MKNWNSDWSPEDEAALVALWQKDVPIKEIATRMQRSEGAIRKRVAMIRRRGKPLRKHRLRAQRERVDARVLPLLEARMTVAEVSYRLCLTLGTVRRSFARIMKTREARPQPRADVSRIIELWQSGLTTGAVANQLGIPIGTVCRTIWEKRRKGALDAAGKPIRSNRMNSEFLSEAATNNRHRRAHSSGRQA